ncbi:hypothetical protein MSBR3_0466 [Methanosarcina barkeri 3]|uniref:Uncharacterized protein n=1 Tax=Methanosarcina barkeri 3 TaxID=1434107 RepID=A0A0E3SFF0_METBA|nr:hypothetical protein [Methanosarcina barkeri]AKB81044.1 hypothetical protein MSBR3_0466 [Methanosarcina barkeri 3]
MERAKKENEIPAAFGKLAGKTLEYYKDLLSPESESTLFGNFLEPILESGENEKTKKQQKQKEQIKPTENIEQTKFSAFFQN